MLLEGKMTERDAFTGAKEFTGVDFNEDRPGKWFRKTMRTLSKDPQSQYMATARTGLKPRLSTTRQATVS
jgi:hypothetical protein